MRSHNVSIPSVGPETCRAACDATRDCVAFTHYTASTAAKSVGFDHACTLLANVSGSGAVWRASAGSESDVDAAVGRVGVAGFTTYFATPAGADYSAFGLQRCAILYSLFFGPEANNGPPPPQGCEDVPYDEDTGAPAVWGGKLPVPVHVDSISIYNPSEALGATLVAGSPLMYKARGSSTCHSFIRSTHGLTLVHLCTIRSVAHWSWEMIQTN